MYDVKKAQRLLSAAGYYKGEIDGIVGPKTMQGVNTLLDRHDMRLAMDPGIVDEKRRVTAAVQLILLHQDRPVGPIDGYWGNLTEGAYLEWSVGEVFVRQPVREEAKEETESQLLFPLQSQCATFYGNPGEEVERQLVYVESPFDLIIEWDQSQRTRNVRIHRKCSDQLEVVLHEVLDAYGLAEINRLGLNQYSGSYVHRRMRGGTSWSMHAYGCATDFLAAKNGLLTRCPEAAFCDPVYEEYLDIWEQNGFVSLGREIGRDYMHFQAARLG